MYISKIRLENIRGFRSGELRVDLDLLHDVRRQSRNI